MRLSWVHSMAVGLVIPARYAPAWEGSDAPSEGRIVEATFRYDPKGPATDYDRACDVSGWLGVIPVGRGQALVLSGDKTSAAYYHWRRGHYLLRWLYADSETELLDHFHDVHAQLPVEEEAMFRHPGGLVYLMSATDLPGRWLLPHTELSLPRGRYRVWTSHSETEKMYIIIHKLKRD
jgi:hypothetical protein